MVAIFTGAGTGMERGSGNVLGGAGLLGSGSVGRSGQQVLLNAANGNLLVSQRDEFLVGRGPDAVVNRTYNSLGDLSDDNGDNWRQSTQRRILDLVGTINGWGSTVKRIAGDGTVSTYSWNGSAYVTTDGAGAYDRITCDGTWRWTDGDTGVVETYAANNNYISQMSDTSGNTVTYVYSGNQLVDVTTSNGERIHYGWSGASLVEIQTVTAQGTQTRTRYDYDGYGRLANVAVDLTPADNATSDGNRYVTSYTYHGASKLVASITETDGSRLDIGYDGANRVTSLIQTVANGVSRTTTIGYGSGQTVVTDAHGQTTTLHYDGAGQLTAIVTPPPASGQGAQTTSFSYNGNGDVTGSTNAAGTTYYQHDGNGNVDHIWNAGGVGTWRRYNAANKLLLEMHDASEPGGEYRSTRYAYDAQNRLRFMVDAQGVVTEYGVDWHGEPAWSRRYVASDYDTSGWSWDMPLNYHDLANWAVAADKSGSEFVAYAYDTRLNLTQTVTYGRSDAAGNVTTSDGYTHEYYSYDASGRLLSHVTAGLNAETFVYDGLGRVTASTTGAATTNIVFNDAASQTVVTLASGLVRTSTYNRAGELVSETESGLEVATGTTTYEYDALGRARKTTDANGFASFAVYDRVGHKVADINQSGWMTEYRYDAADRLVATIRYALTLDANQRAQAFDVAASPDIAGLRPAAHVYDILQWTVYDGAGRAIGTILGDGSVTRFDNDRSDRLVRTTQYANRLSQAQIDGFRAAPPTGLVLPGGSANDTVTRTFYDRAGRIVGTLDGEGWLTRVDYDKGGRKVAETAFHNATDTGLRAGGTFGQLVASVGSHAQDATTRYVYDGQGNVRFTIDALNRVTEHGYQYDTPAWNWAWSAHGPERVTTRYAGTIAALGSYTIDSVRAALSNAGLVGNAGNRIRYDVYDNYHESYGRLMYSIEADGSVVGFRYDTMGRVIRKVQYAERRITGYLPGQGEMDNWSSNAIGLAETRIERYFYNARGELRFVVDAEGYVTRNDYDAGGQRTLSVRWSNPVAANDSWTVQTVGANQSGDSATTTFQYDGDGRLIRTTDAVGTVRDYSYYANGKLALDIASEGQGDESRTLFVYDAGGKLTSRYDAYNTAEQACTQYGYDGRGNITEIVDANGRSRYRGYDKASQLVSETNAAGGTTAYTYDALGNQTRITDARGHSTYSYHDALGRVVAVRDAENYVTETSYTAFGDIASVTRRASPSYTAAGYDWPHVSANSGDATTSFEYDKLGRATRTIDAEGYSEYRQYDAFGDVTRITNKIGGTTDFAYRRRGQLHYEYIDGQVYDSNGQSLGSGYYKNLYEYDWRGNVSVRHEGYASPTHRVTTYVYDKADRLVAKSLQNVQILNAGDHASLTTGTATETYAYDTRGNLTQVTDPNGARTLYYYDDQDRKVAEVGPTGTLSQYFHDAVGNVLRSRTWITAIGLPGSPGGSPPGAPGGEYRDTVYTYDALNRLLTSSVEAVRTGKWDGSSFALALGTVTTASYQYDAMGNVVAVTDGNGVTSYNYYDTLGRKSRAVDGEGHITGWLYDAQGNVWHERRWRDKVPYANAGGWADPGTSADDRVTEFLYDRNGRRLSEQRSNVAAFGVHGGGTLYGNGGTSTLSYAYNGLGEVTTRTEATGEQTTFQYDSSGRLYAETRAGFTDADGNSVQPLLIYRYDALGNLVYTAQTAEGGGAVRETRNVYDAAGRLTSTQDAAGATTSYYYDAAGSLLRQSYQRTRAQDGGFLEAILYTRDAAGRVVGQTIGQWNGSWWVKGDSQDTQYNGYGEVCRRGINGGWQEEFHHDATGQVWKSNAGDGVWRYFVHDGAGNRTLTIESEGSWIGGQWLDPVLSMATQGFSQSAGATYIDGLNVSIAIFDRRNQQTGTYLPKRQLSESGGVQDLWSSRTYTAFGEVATETDALGYVTSYSYNTMGRTTSITRPQVNVTAENGAVSLINPVENFWYDRSGRLIATGDANGNTVRRQLLAGTGYGGKGALVTREWHADGGYLVNAYDRFGDLRRATDAVGRVTTMSYDAMGRLTYAVRPSGQWDGYAYDTLGQRVSHWTSLYGAGAPETTTYDQQGRVIAQANMAGDVTATGYAWHWLTGAGSAGGWTQTTTFANGRSSVERTDVFGHILSTTNMGGQTTDFVYDYAGRVVSRAGAETMAYGWLNTGLLGSLSRGYGNESTAQSNYGESWSRERTAYGYDARGLKIRETYTSAGGSWQDYGYQDPWDYNWYPDWQYTSYSSTISDGVAAYDALGRMVGWSQTGAAPSASLAYEYDAVGNVRRTYATHAILDQNGNVAGSTVQDRWYRYDAMNRMVTSKGMLSGGQIVRGYQGVDYAYDTAGERVRATRTLGRSMQVYDPYYDPYNYDPYGYGGGYGSQYTTAYYDAEVREDYAYEADGQLSTVRIAESGAYDNYDGTVTVTAPAATGALKANYYYDGMGRQTRQIDWLGDGYSAAYDRQVSLDIRGRVDTEWVSQRQGNDTLVSTTYNSYADLLAGATYALTHIHRLANGSSYVGMPSPSTSTSYTWYDGPVVSSVVYKPDYIKTPSQTTSYAYGAGGTLASVYVGDGRPRSIAFTSDMLGQTIRRDESDNNYNAYSGGDPHEIWYRFDGRQVGYTGNNGTADTDYAASIAQRTQTPGTGAFRGGQSYGGAYAEFDGQVTPITSSAQGSTGGSYTVRSGDTLAGIAAGLWGDAGLWYKLAAANGLTGEAALGAGQILTIPSGVQRSGLSATTFKPFDPADTIGDTSPTTPTPQSRAKKNKCGAFGQILLVAIAVAVTVATSGAAAAAMASAATGTSVSLGAGIGLAFGGTLAGTSIGLSTLGMVMVGTVGAVAGSVASQGIGVATGLQDQFSWKDVAMAGLSAGIGGAMGAAIPGSGIASAAARGVAGSAVMQGIGLITKLQSRFDWAGVAAAGVAAAAGNVAGRLAVKAFGLNLGMFEGRFVSPGDHAAYNAISGTAAFLANAGIRSLATGTSFGDNVLAGLTDVIGSTIGNYVAASISVDRAGIQAAQQARLEQNASDLQEILPGADLSGINAATQLLVSHPNSWTARRDYSRQVTQTLIANQGNPAVDDLIKQLGMDLTPVSSALAETDILVKGNKDYFVGSVIDKSGIWLGEKQKQVGTAVANFMDEHPGAALAARLFDTAVTAIAPGRALVGMGIDYFKDGISGWIAGKMEGERRWNADKAQAGGNGFVLGASIIAGGVGASKVRGSATDTAVPRIHKNSLDYVGDTHVYVIRRSDGSLYKVGESAQGVRVRDGASIRGEQQVRALRRESGEFYRSEIRNIFDSKANARSYEKHFIQTYKRMYGQRPPGNLLDR